MQSRAATVEQYLAELPEDRRTIITQVREVVRANLNPGFEEGMQYGMIGYYIPHSLYPAGYHCDPQQPLPFACLAAQKNYCSLYAMSLYAEGEHYAWFMSEWAKTGKKLDMGKSCIRFRKVEDLALDVIAEALRKMTVAKWIAVYDSSLKDMRKRTAEKPAVASKKKAAKKTPAKKSTTAVAKASVKKSVKKTVKKSTKKTAAKKKSAPKRKGTR